MKAQDEPWVQYVLPCDPHPFCSEMPVSTSIITLRSKGEKDMVVDITDGKTKLEKNDT